MAEPWARYMAQKRERAREAGLCATCCTRTPAAGRKICELCKASARQRTIGRRFVLRKRAELRNVIEEHERAGDLARDHHLHETAAQHYERAFETANVLDAQNGSRVQILCTADRSRIAEKLATMLFFGGDPERAKSWLERALEGYSSPASADKAVTILINMQLQMWLDCKTQTTLFLLTDAIARAQRAGNSLLYNLLHAIMAYYLHTLGRYSESDVFFTNITSLENIEEPVAETSGNTYRLLLLCQYYNQSAVRASAYGETERTFAHFERGVQAAQRSMYSFNVTTLWDDYGLAAAALGKIEIAKACHERALFVARQNHIVWRTSYLCLRYADVLARIGHYETAHEYLNETFAYNVQIPRVATLLAAVGIPLALHMKDEAALKRCAWKPAIEHAFQSGEEILIGRVASAFARWYASHGDHQRARALLRRACANVKHIDQCWELALEIARSGGSREIACARELLEQRIALPAPEVTRAYLRLFNALIAKRNGKIDESYGESREAVRGFSMLQWHGYADTARELLPAGIDREIPAHGASQTTRDKGPLSDISPALTPREQQVAQLVLRGFTNRAIATELSITEHTVEGHMTSIFNRLGLRSRWQLVDSLGS